LPFCPGGQIALSSFCPKGVQNKIVCGVSKQNVLKGENKKMSGGSQDKLSEGGKMGEKSCPRRVKLTKNCHGGHKKKTCPRGGNKSCFVSEGVRKIPVFVQG